MSALPTIALLGAPGTGAATLALDLQQRVRGVYLDAAREDAAFRVVDCCAPDGSMETPERIFSKIEAALAPLLNAAADA